MSSPAEPDEASVGTFGREEIEETLPGDEDRLAPDSEAAERDALERGAAVGRYTVLERVGAGGMGIVYAAFDPQLDRRIALKIMHGGSGRRVGHARLLREARAMARLSHPNVITVHDVGTIGDRVFVAMEFIEGATLRAWLEEDPRPWPEVVEAFVKAGRGLAAAHAAGLVHRDFKPDNVLMGSDGRVLVMDFGLAVQASPASKSCDSQTVTSRPLDATDDPPNAPLTRTGGMPGTPAYMAPEQHAGNLVGPLSDQFSFCVALYEGLYGERPFSGSNRTALAVNVIEGRVRPAPRDNKVPSWLREVVLRGLSVDPSDRYVSIDALLAELQRDPPRSRRPWAIAGIASGVVALLAGGYYLSRPGPDASCKSAGTQLQGVWDEPRRQTAHQAFTSTDLPYAEASWLSASEELDAFAHRFDAAFESACRADLIQRKANPKSGGAAAALACLDQRLAALEALTDTFTHADAVVVEHAVAAVQSLPGVDVCSIIQTASDARVSTDDRETMHDLQKRLAGASSLLRTGRPRQALQEGLPLLERAKELGSPAVEADALLLVARAQDALGEAGPAERSLRQAILSVSTTNRADIEADIWAAMVEVVGNSRGLRGEARRLGLAAEAAIRRSGDDPRQHAALLLKQGAIEQAGGQYDTALDQHLRALELRREQLDAKDLDLAWLEEGVGLALAGLARFDEAHEHHRNALSIREQVLGAQHPLVGLSLVRLGHASLGAGELRQAEASLVRARMLLDPHGEVGTEDLPEPGPAAPTEPEPEKPLRVSPYLPLALDGLGLLARAKQEFAEAARFHARAAALVEARSGATHPDLAYPLQNLGLALTDLRRPDEAVIHLRRALEIWEASLEPLHPDLATAHLDLANALWALGSFSEAREHYGRALAIWEEALGPEHPLVAYALTGLGRIHLELGTYDSAVEYLERALEIRDHEDEDQLNLAETCLLLARTLWSIERDNARAVELLLRARDLTGAFAPNDPSDVRRVLSGGEVPQFTEQLVPAGLGVSNPRHLLR